MSKLGAWLKSLALPIAIIIVIIVAGYFAFLRLKHPILTRLAVLRLTRMGLRNPKQLIIECYVEMENYFSRLGNSRPHGTPVIDYASTLTDEYQSLIQPIHHITHSANTALYSNAQCSKDAARNCLQGFKQLSQYSPPHLSNHALFKGNRA